MHSINMDKEIKESILTDVDILKSILIAVYERIQDQQEVLPCLSVEADLLTCASDRIDNIQGKLNN